MAEPEGVQPLPPWPYYEQRGVTLYHGDALDCLRALPDESVHCVVTSPPYWGLRHYGMAKWKGGDPECSHSVSNQVQDSKAPGAITSGIRPGADVSRCRKCGARRVFSQIWGGSDSCPHQWDETIPGSARGGSGTPTDKNNRGEGYGRGQPRGDYCLLCGAWRGDLGLEPTPEQYVANIVAVAREVRRVLRADGTLWLNLGDSYASDGKRGGETGGKQAYLDDNNRKRVGREKRFTGLRPKSLVGIPWRVAFALQGFAVVPFCSFSAWADELAAARVAGDWEAVALVEGKLRQQDLLANLQQDGWCLRSDIVWNKSNTMPESTKDRPTKSHEYVFLLSKANRYFYDAKAIEEQAECDRMRGSAVHPCADTNRNNGLCRKPVAKTRNKRDVWVLQTAQFKGAHFATFPPALVEPCVLAGTSERGCCPDCGAPWQRITKTSYLVHRHPGQWCERGQEPAGMNRSAAMFALGSATRIDETLGWEPTCCCYGLPRVGNPPTEPYKKPHETDEHFNERLATFRVKMPAWTAQWDELRPKYEACVAVPCVVLDPFVGSGTTAAVALRFGRRAIGIDLTSEYLDLAVKRIEEEQR